MDNPKISWKVYSQNAQDYEDNNDFFAGTYKTGETMSIDMMIWNNKNGLFRVKDVENFVISVSFHCLEDTTLLKFLTGEIDNTIVSPTIVGDTMAVFPAPAGKIISGKANDGSIKNTENFIKFKLYLSVPDKYVVKANDLKTITLDVIQE